MLQFSFRNVFLFSNGVVTPFPKLMPATDKNKAIAYHKIRNLSASGGTNVYDAFDQGFHFIAKNNFNANYKGGVDTIFFLYDGEPTRGKFTKRDDIIAEVMRWNKFRKVRIVTIVFGTPPRKGLSAPPASPAWS